MKLSVIIVNYNVLHFLEQCLYSVREACSAIDAEIFVVDNNSVDGSCHMVRNKFPEVTLIENNENLGFAKANNQAIRQANGQYILLLNPDTLVKEDCFSRCIRFMDKNPQAGALGVKMIDGKGRFLPESKRALPTPAVAFYKIFGFSRLFPASRRFSRYYLGHLHPDKIHEVDVLTGAFMLLRKEALDSVGLLDEDYFMYGEDIDLSYRISLAGYKNYYFPETTIIHYKGESTKKGSINYIKTFYQAMIIFARKHFQDKWACSFSFLIRMAIGFRAMLSVAKRFVSAVFLPILDATAIYLGYQVLVPLWEEYWFDTGHFPDEYMHQVVPVYIAIWIMAIGLNKGYQKPVKLRSVIRGIATGTLAILVLYAIIGEQWRFSRALILLGAMWTFITLWTIRQLLAQLPFENFRLTSKRKKKVVVVASFQEADRISQILNELPVNIKLVGVISPYLQLPPGNYLGTLSQIREVARIHKPDELIFSANDLSSGQIIQCILLLADLNLEFKIATPESLSIIGSNSTETTGELYVVPVNAISSPKNQRNKRLLDSALAFIFVICIPALYWLIKPGNSLCRNIYQVILGRKSWVGYASEQVQANELPPLKPGVLSPADLFSAALSPEKKKRIDLDYAKNYRILTDLKIIFRNLKRLGQ